jgi:hypothetical protein
MLESVEPERLFLATCTDLEGRITHLDEYGLLRAAGLLRQLLLDETRLIDVVNRKFRIKVAFLVMDRRSNMEMVAADGAEFYSVEDGLDPSTARPGTTIELTRDQLLKWKVMFVSGHYVTVHDLIDQLAHIEGGVHSGSPKTDKEKSLVQAAGMFGIGGLPAGIRMVAAIGRVVVSGLAPLRNRVQAQP